MNRNLIITCGTSQIKPAKFKDTPVRIKLDHFIAHELNDKDKPLVDEEFLDEKEIAGFAEEISDLILLQWNDRCNLLGEKNNMFGAEISTLVAMEKEGGSYAWDPQTDDFVFIASQSRAGLFTAELNARILEKGWAVDLSRVSTRMVPQLTSDASDPDTAMYNLATIIGGSLKESTPTKEIKNIFVASGGFKSSIPLLTIYSFLFGIKLVYTYEYSATLQSLNPRVNMEDETSKQFWKYTWDKMNQQKWLGEGGDNYLHQILNYRMKFEGNF